MENLRNHWLPIGILIATSIWGLLGAYQVHAYQWIQSDDGDGAPSAGVTSGTNWNSGTTIDCVDAGISEINRLDVWGDASGTWTAIAMLDGERANVYNTYSNTATSTTMTGSTTISRFQLSWFTPIWCAGRSVDLVFERLSGSPFFMSDAMFYSKTTIISAGSGSGYSFPYQRSWCNGQSQTSCTEVGRLDLNVFATDATSTALGGDTTTVSVVNDFTGIQLAITALGSLSLWLMWLRFWFSVVKRKV